MKIKAIEPCLVSDLINSARRCLLATLVAITIFLMAGPLGAQTSLDSLLKPYLTRYDLPAAAAAVVKDGKVISAGDDQ